MRPRSISDFPPLCSEQAVTLVVRGVVGNQLGVHVSEWHVRRENYVVACVEAEPPAMRLIVKLEIPGERPNRHFDTMAALSEMVRAQTSVPTFDVVAVDVKRREWPWAYLIVTQLPGVTWHRLYPRLDDAARSTAQWQIGRSAAELHGLRFASFGQIGPAGAVVDGATAGVALARRARRRIRTPRYLDLMLDLLESRASLFESLSIATLVHEDMNPYNLVFEMRDGQPVLSGILDFESAWASTGESDLARLELWALTAGGPLREGYTAVVQLADGYAARKPVLQLLWCLEYADFNSSAEHQVVTDGVCAELGIAPIQLG
ncbi:MAG: phosphotransferase [Chloroflexota bacterium]|nr:phosphotransferase [Chloroflexota bacterium]